MNKITNIADAYLDEFHQCMEWAGKAKDLDGLRAELDFQITAMLNGWSTLSTPEDVKRWDNE